MRIRRQTVEHPFGTLKSWMGSTHFQMKTLKHVRTEASLHILAYNFKRLVAILGVPARSCPSMWCKFVCGQRASFSGGLWCNL